MFPPYKYGLAQVFLIRELVRCTTQSLRTPCQRYHMQHIGNRSFVLMTLFLYILAIEFAVLHTNKKCLSKFFLYVGSHNAYIVYFNKYIGYS
jgi:hypothetical protein